MTKQNEREQARQLRREQGLSIIEIAAKIGVAKSSVSTWVRDIQLTTEQIQRLEDNHNITRAQHLGSKANVLKHRILRQQYQEHGRAKAREGDLLHAQGCMLYWAEGNKDRQSVKFVNSDADMMVMFIKFLRESLQVPEEKITIYVNCYLGNGLSHDEITGYWLNLLQLDKTRLRKGAVNNQPISSQQKGRKLIYGVCSLSVTSTQYVQHIFGAIQEYAGISKPEWLE